jgi:hypothetical protein
MTAVEFVKLNYQTRESLIQAAEKDGARLKITYSCGKHAVKFQESNRLLLDFADSHEIDTVMAIKEQEVIHSKWNCDVTEYLRVKFHEIEKGLGPLKIQRLESPDELERLSP